MTRLALLLPLALLAGCKEDAPKPKTAPTAAKAEKGSEPPPGFAAGGNTNYQAGAGALQNTRQAARRTVALNDMKNLGTYITQMETLNGKMPTKTEILAEVKQDATLSKLLADGTVILTGTSKRDGLWAYEAEADTKGGIGLVGGVANRYDAAQIKTYLQGG